MTVAAPAAGGASGRARASAPGVLRAPNSARALGRARGAAAALLLGLALASAGAAPAVPLTPLEQHGKRVYLEGASPSGKPIKALIGGADTPVDGTALPCVNCHASDGAGKPEGVVKPSNVTWPDLTKSYGHRREGGRTHPPYDEQSFYDSITVGKDPAGNKLDPTMPRYLMPREDLVALLAYMKRIETDFDPGLSPERLRIGTLLPQGGRLGELGQAMGAVLDARVAALNAAGGLYGRRVDLVRADLPDERAAALANAERLFREQEVFAVVSPIVSGIDDEVGQLAEAAKVPVVGPFTLRTQGTQQVNRQTFYLLPGLAEQTRVLAEFAVKELKLTDPAVAVVHPDEEAMRPVAEAALATLRERGWNRSLAVHYPSGAMPAPELVARLQQAGAQVLVFLGTDAELERLGPAIRDAIWTPYLLAPGARAGRAAVSLPITLGNRVFLSYPTQPKDITREGASALAALQRQAGLPARHQPAQVSAYASMLVLEEGLKRAGRDLSRAKLVNALENLFSFETTVTPAVSYGPTRRVGALGGYVMAVDLTTRRLRPVGGYIRLE